MLIRSLVLLAATFLAACSMPTGLPGGAVTLHLEQVGEPEGRSPAPVRWRVSNGSAAVVYLDACGDSPRFQVEKELEGSWIRTHSGYCQADRSTISAPLEPGAMMEGEFTISAGSGLYRFLLMVYDDRSSSNPVVTRSNAVILR